MRVRLPLALAIVAGAWSVPFAAADPVGRHLDLTPVGGITVFDGDLRFSGRPVKDGLYVGGRLGYPIHWLFTLEAAGGITPTKDAANNKVSASHFSADVMMTPWQALYGGPYLFGGAGSASIKPSGGGSLTNSGFEVGGGWRAWLTDRIGLRLETRQIAYSRDLPTGTRRINHMIYSAGLTWALGANGRDTDQDGVPDRSDLCPGTPKGATVDAHGCTHDSDGDGVLDGLDKCQGTPKGATVDATGCPKDSDGDGVFDGIDKCPDTPKGATVDATGCPKDSDGDGVLDGLDKCEGTPKGATVDATGCPKDSDQDGVFDGLDKCPDTAAGLKVDKDGCPIEVMEKETELLDTGMIRLQNVNFETNKAALLPESFPVLDVVGHVLTQWPELQIEIGGHTDSRGSEKHNQRLSEARADSVKAYLTTRFPQLKPEQFTAKGYGKSRPVVPNNSELNMAKNRRVEFVVLNRDVLKREIEHRRLLKTGEGAPADTTKKK